MGGGLMSGSIKYEELDDAGTNDQSAELRVSKTEPADAGEITADLQVTETLLYEISWISSLTASLVYSGQFWITSIRHR